MESLEKFFESVYTESLQRLTEISKINFKAKIDRDVSGREYARAFLKLDPTGQTTPIQLTGSLGKDKYKWENQDVNNSTHFTMNASYNTFLIEKLYEELLLDKGRGSQSKIQTFFLDFVEDLQKHGVPFNRVTFANYEDLVA